VREALFGNRIEAIRNAAAVERFSNGKDAVYGAALAFALAGNSLRAKALTKDLAQRYPEDTIVRFSFVPTLQSIAAIQRGEANKAVDLLQPAAPYELGSLGCCSVGFVGSLYPVYVRGEAYLALKRGTKAAAEFQKIIDYRGLAGSNPIGVLAYWRKAKGLALAGNNREARKEYEQFLSFWRDADTDVPIFRSVKAEYAALLVDR
jgi:tetratricopeptide (TPR) repeat protein